ncbi:Rhodanese-related sulfurtransferase [Reichenbachiella faecimaris]|uniref:Rhodanese-related sulfurtransferase n=1 Tax=Reichenbachiella faecimaris TaxID=692418 RepID=A0A1W2GQI8_REIFA|nr:rhodanese-like domain-containing protein [Reichenbachiella faecimaris]SMD38945.1 Rhodanese-related sulfurtransferase [Reichenbachiella faecimaris]
MRNVFMLSLLLFLSVSCTAQRVDQLTPEQFKAQINNETSPFKILDLRTDDEVAQGKIPGAEPLDFYGEKFEEKLGELNKETTYYIYCRSGGRSGKTLAKMKALNFERIYEMDGGMNAWKAAGLEIE